MSPCKTKMARQAPFVSVILPVRDEAAYIQRCLEAVMSQDYAFDRMEVLVVDGMSSDGTRDSIAQIIASQPKFPLSMLDNPAHIIPTALNIGLRKAKGDILVRVDGHCVIAPDFISRCVKHIQNGGIDGVGGSVETVGETWLSQSIAIVLSSSFGVGDSKFRTYKGNQHMYTDSIPFPAYPAETIRRGGLYDEDMYCNEDDDYNFRLRKLGMKLLLAGDIRSVYYCRLSLFSLWRQWYKYGCWKVRVLQKNPRQMSLRQFIPPVFVAALAVSLLLFFMPFIPDPISLILFSSILGSYLLVNFLASIVISSHWHLWRYFIVLPLNFAILHFSYGSGFLVGLVKFAGRWGDQVGKVLPFRDSLD